MVDTFERSAARMDAIAEELDRARQHVQTAAVRFREEQPPNAGAHAFAAIGHLRRALRLLDDAAIAFAQRSAPTAEDAEQLDLAD